MTDTGLANELRLDARVGDRTEPYAFLTRDGLDSKDEIRREDLALLETVSVQSDDDVLVIDGNYGVLGTVLGDIASDGETVITETSARAATTCRENAVRNGVENVTVELTADVGDLRNDFDLASFAPKPYDPVDAVKERISRAATRLSIGGTFYIAGTKNDGITRYAETLSELLTEVEQVSIEGACHVYRGEKDETFEPRTYLTEHEFRATIGEYTCRFLTVPGLFSWEALDDGTAALLRNVSVPDGSRVLDYCCGYGAVGAFVGARTDCELWATDDNVVATTYAEENFDRNGVTPEAVITGDGTDGVATETFDVILSNPPTHAGSGVTTKLFSGARDVLAPDGVFYLVANGIMQYDEKLAQDFDFDTTVVAEEGNYDVIGAHP